MDIGGEDFALENGMEPTEETLLMPKQQMIYAARAAGINALGYIASVASFGDLSAFGAWCSARASSASSARAASIPRR